MEHVHVKKIMKEKKKQVLFQAEIRKVWYIWWISSTPSGKERVRKDPTSWSNQRNFFTFLWILTEGECGSCGVVKFGESSVKCHLSKNFRVEFFWIFSLWWLRVYLLNYQTLCLTMWSQNFSKSFGIPSIPWRLLPYSWFQLDSLEGLHGTHRNQ